MNKFSLIEKNSEIIKISVTHKFILNQCSGSISFWCGSGSWTGKIWIRIQVNYNLLKFFLQEYTNFMSYFFAYFYAKTFWTIQNSGIFYNLSLFKSSDLRFWSKLFMHFFVDNFPIGSGSRKPKSCGSRS